MSPHRKKVRRESVVHTRLVIGSSLSQQNVNLLLDPFLVVGRIRVRRLLIDEATQVAELIDEVKQLADVVGDRRRIRVLAFQVLLEDLADALHALVHALKVGVGARFHAGSRLNQQNCVRHFFSFDERKNKPADEEKQINGRTQEMSRSRSYPSFFENRQE